MRKIIRGRRASIGGLMASNFLKRLDAGVVIDRNHVSRDGVARKKIPAPPGLVRAVPLNSASDVASLGPYRPSLHAASQEGRTTVTEEQG
jgi:hypothetical protein